MPTKIYGKQTNARRSIPDNAVRQLPPVAKSRASPNWKTAPHHQVKKIQLWRRTAGKKVESEAVDASRKIRGGA